MKRIFLALQLLFCFSQALATGLTFSMAYIDIWKLNRPPDYTLSFADFANWKGKYTHFIVFKVDPTLNPPYWKWDGGYNTDGNLSTLVDSAHAYGIKVILCIGGVTQDSWATVAQDSAAAQRSIDAIGQFCRTYRLDGMDLDWETNPTLNGFRMVTRMMEREMQSWSPAGELVAALGREYSSAFDISYLNTKYTYLNIMTYDGAGFWNDPRRTAFHEPVYDPTPNYPAGTYPSGQVANRIDRCAETWANAGLTRSKTSLIFGGYIRRFVNGTGATGPAQAFSYFADCEGIGDYQDVLSAMETAGGTTGYDTLANMEWWGNTGSSSATSISFSNHNSYRSLSAKCAYAKAKGWGGVSMFTIDQSHAYRRPLGLRDSLTLALAHAMDPPQPAAPTFLTNPQNVTVFATQPATFGVSVNGYPDAALQWQKSTTSGGSTYANIGGATSATYTTAPTVSGDDGYKFRCIASNELGTATSSAATLTVTTPVTATPTSDDFHDTTATKALWRFTNSSVTGLQGAGTSDARVIFYLDGTRRDLWSDNKLAPIVWQKPTNVADGAFEVVTKWDAVPGAAYLAQGIVFKGADGTYLRGGEINYAPGRLRFWAGEVNGSNTTQHLDVTISVTSPFVWVKVSRLGTLWTSSYSTDGTTYTVAGTYTRSITLDSVGVFASNSDAGGGSPTYQAKCDYFFNTASPISPEDPVTGGTPPSITTHPSNQATVPGGSATFEVAASGSAPLSYQWKRGNTDIGGATTSSYTITSVTYASDNGATFKCVVSNAHGTATSNSATLSVVVIPPTIVSQPQNTIVSEGQTAAFNVEATGTPTLAYQWYVDGVSIGGATSKSYTTPATDTDDNGTQFSCVVSNAYGSATSNKAVLTVNAGTTPTVDSLSIIDNNTSKRDTAATRASVVTIYFTTSNADSVFVEFNRNDGRGWRSPESRMLFLPLRPTSVDDAIWIRPFQTAQWRLRLKKTDGTTVYSSTKNVWVRRN